VAMPRVVRHRRHISLGFDEDLRPIASDDTEKWLLLRLQEPRLKTKLLAVEGDSSFDVADDERWGDCV